MVDVLHAESVLHRERNVAIGLVQLGVIAEPSTFFSDFIPNGEKLPILSLERGNYFL
jgi:hypothetical protein